MVKELLIKEVEFSTGVSCFWDNSGGGMEEHSYKSKNEMVEVDIEEYNGGYYIESVFFLNNREIKVNGGELMEKQFDTIEEAEEFITSGEVCDYCEIDY